MKAILTPLLFFAATSLPAQQMTLEQIDKDLYHTYQKLLYYRIELNNIDSIEMEGDLFSKKMTGYISAYPITLNYKFDSLQSSVHIITSEDKLFRIYSWDTWEGGTEQDFANLFQYKADKVYSKLSYDISGQVYSPFYSQIFTLKANNKTYYLAIGNSMYSSKDVSQSIKVFTIENSLLNDTVKLIKTHSGFANSIDVNFDFFSVVDRPERPVQLIKYDAANKIISIPIVDEKGKVTSRFIRYQFTGQYFERIKSTGQ